MRNISIRGLFLIASIISSLLVSGCATTESGARNLSDIGRYTSLKQGFSTKKDVFILFGQPHDVQHMDDKTSLWRYFQTKSSTSVATFIPFVGLVAGGVDSQTLITTIHFDDRNNFSRLNTRDVKKTTNMWAGLARATELGANDQKGQRVESEMSALNLPFDKGLAQSMRDIEVFAEN